MKRLDFETAVLRAIVAPKLKQKDIACFYMTLICLKHFTDFKKVNAAIMARWSCSGLQTIKRMAWKEIERGNPEHPRTGRQK